ncbi:MAG TPA: nitroreductase family protein [bacterium]
MDVFDAIRSRRSIRIYSTRPVERGTLETVLEAARLAPSANNRQEWRFVVVQDQETRHKLAIAAKGQGFVGEAPVVIACCAVESGHVMTCGQSAYTIDLAIAIDHITLAARALDLGTCWVGAFYEERVRNVLGIPDSIRVVGLLTLGYPRENPAPRPRKKLEDIVAYETWS